MVALAVSQSLATLEWLGGHFSPATLFATSEPGVWYDPSDVANTLWLYNLLTFTEQFDNAAWGKSGATITANASTSPIGDTSADKIVEGTGLAARLIFSSAAAASPASATVTASVYVKDTGESRFLQFFANDSVSAGRSLAVINPVSGAVLASSGVTALAVSVGNGWYRFSATYISGTTTNNIQIRLADTFQLIEDAYTGNGVSGLLIWGAQLELGSTATTYQPITTVAAEAIARFPQATLYQDSAGTTPVTAPNQPVGLMLDKSKNGIGTNGSSRRNLLTFSEQFDNAAWSKSNVTVSANTTVAPDGTSTAETLTAVIGLSNHRVISSTATLASGQSCVHSVYFKAGTYNFVQIHDGASASYFANFNLTSGTVTSSTGCTATITAVGSGWYRCSISMTLNAANPILGIALISSGAAARNESWLALGTETVFVWGAQVDASSTATTYQPITSSWVDTIPGNHATQSTAGSRPTYGIVPATGRRNLLQQTEVFTNAYWLTQGGSWSAVNSTGFQTFTEDTGLSQHRLYKENLGMTSGLAYTVSARVSYGTRQWVFLSIFDGTATVSGWFDLLNGIKGSVSASASTIMSTVSPGVYDISLTRTAAGTTANGNVQIGTQISDNASTSWTANGSSVNVSRYQFEQSATATAYQKVVTDFEVTEANVASLSYIFFDGINRFMVTPTITPATDKVQVFAGVRKLSDAANAVIAEMSTLSFNNGSFVLQGPSTTLTTYLWRSCGTSNATVSANFSAPITNVITGIGDISGDLAILRVNGSQVAQDTANQGTGNYLAYPLYIGRRGGTTLPFNGQMYGLITRFGANLNTSQLVSTEGWVNTKTGAY